MKKLGKKSYLKQTIEAFSSCTDCNCSCTACSCQCLSCGADPMVEVNSYGSGYNTSSNNTNQLTAFQLPSVNKTF